LASDASSKKVPDPSYTSIDADLAPSKLVDLANDEGELEVVTGEEEAMVTIDGIDIGKGDTARKALRAGTHVVMVVWRGQQVRESVPVKPGRMTRLTVEDAWEQ